MTYLIQKAKTSEFFHNGTWTLNSSWAEEFPDLVRALSACVRHELYDVELVLQFGFEVGRHYTMRLPLPEGLLLDSWSKRSSACSLVSP